MGEGNGTAHLPAGLQKFFQVVLGLEWPEANEGGLRELRDAWSSSATAVEAFSEVVDADAALVAEALQGALGEQVLGYLRTDLADGVGEVVEAMRELSRAAGTAAADVQKAKIMLIAMAALALATVISLLYSLIFSFLVPAVEAAAQVGLRLVLRELAARIASLSVRGVGASAVKLGVDAAKFGAFGGVFMGGLDGGIQVGQIVAGQREGFDWESLKGSVIGGVVGGAVGGVAHGLSRGVVSGLSAEVRGRVSGSVRALGHFGYASAQVAAAGVSNPLINVATGMRGNVWDGIIGAASRGHAAAGGRSGTAGGELRVPGFEVPGEVVPGSPSLGSTPDDASVGTAPAGTRSHSPARPVGEATRPALVNFLDDPIPAGARHRETTSNPVHSTRVPSRGTAPVRTETAARVTAQASTSGTRVSAQFVHSGRDAEPLHTAPARTGTTLSEAVTVAASGTPGTTRPSSPVQAGEAAAQTHPSDRTGTHAATSASEAPQRHTTFAIGERPLRSDATLHTGLDSEPGPSAFGPPTRVGTTFSEAVTAAGSDPPSRPASKDGPAQAGSLRDVLPEYVRTGRALGGVAVNAVGSRPTFEAHVKGLLSGLGAGDVEGAEAITAALFRGRFESLMGDGGRSAVRVGGEWFEVRVRADVRFGDVAADLPAKPASLGLRELKERHTAAVDDSTAGASARALAMSTAGLLPFAGPYASVSAQVPLASPAVERTEGNSLTAQTTLRTYGDVRAAGVPVDYHITVTDEAGRPVATSTHQGEVELLVPEALISSHAPPDVRQAVATPAWSWTVEWIAPDALLVNEDDLFGRVGDALSKDVVRLGAPGRSTLSDFLSGNGIRAALPVVLAGGDVVSPELRSRHGDVRDAVRMRAHAGVATLVDVLPGQGQVRTADSAEHQSSWSAATREGAELRAIAGAGTRVHGMATVLGGLTGSAGATKARTAGGGADTSLTTGLRARGDIGLYRVDTTIEVTTPDGQVHTAPAVAYARLGLREAHDLGLPVPEGTSGRFTDVGERFEPPLLAAGAASGQVRVGRFDVAHRVVPAVEAALRRTPGLEGLLHDWNADAERLHGGEFGGQLVNSRKLTTALSPAALRAKFGSLIGPGISVSFKMSGLLTDRFVSVTVKARTGPGTHLGRAEDRTISRTAESTSTLTGSTATDVGWSAGAEGRAVVVPGSGDVSGFVGVSVSPIQYSDNRSARNRGALAVSAGKESAGGAAHVFDHDVELEIQIQSHTRARPWVRRLTPGSPFRTAPVVTALPGPEPISGRAELWVDESSVLREDPSEFAPGTPAVTPLPQPPAIDALVNDGNPAILRWEDVAHTEFLRDQALRLMSEAAGGDGVLGLPGSAARDRLDAMFSPERLGARSRELLTSGLREGGFRFERRVADRVGAVGVRMSLHNPRVVTSSDAGRAETAWTGVFKAGAEKVRRRALGGNAQVLGYANGVGETAVGRGQTAARAAWTPWGRRQAVASEVTTKIDRANELSPQNRTVLVRYDATARVVAESRRESLLDGAVSWAAADIALPGSVFAWLTEEQARHQGLLPGRAPRAPLPDPLAGFGGDSGVFGMAALEESPDLGPLVQATRGALGGLGDQLLPRSLFDDSMGSLEQLRVLTGAGTVGSLLDDVLDGGVPLSAHTTGLLTSAGYAVRLKGTVLGTEFAGVRHDEGELTSSVTSSRGDRRIVEKFTSAGGQLRIAARGMFSSGESGTKGSEGVSGGVGVTRDHLWSRTTTTGAAATRAAMSGGPQARDHARIRFELEVSKGTEVLSSVTTDAEVTVLTPADDRRILRQAAPPVAPATADVPEAARTPESLTSWRGSGATLPPTTMVTATRGAAELRAAATRALALAGAPARLTGAGTGPAHTLASALTNSGLRAGLTTMADSGLPLPALHDTSVFHRGEATVTVHARLSNPRLLGLSETVKLLQAGKQLTAFTAEAAEGGTESASVTAGEGAVGTSSGHWFAPPGLDLQKTSRVLHAHNSLAVHRPVVVQHTGLTGLVRLDADYRVVAGTGEGRTGAAEVRAPGSVVVRMTVADIAKLFHRALPEVLRREQDAVRSADLAWLEHEELARRAQFAADDLWLYGETNAKRWTGAAGSGAEEIAALEGELRTAVEAVQQDQNSLRAERADLDHEVRILEARAELALALRNAAEPGSPDEARAQEISADLARQEVGVRAELQELTRLHQQAVADFARLNDLVLRWEERGDQAPPAGEVAAELAARAGRAADTARAEWWAAKRALERRIAAFNLDAPVDPASGQLTLW
ncbi:WXG100-like domain-containing protein [Lentzea cavernae]|uniref:Outer membrane channel protein CpnT-like N-terminal domain-containing protein n=1 Tax=Lentzea cavernae TaxID=2020703 RepID=A0ABQ3MSE2_9PSEU|nr:hypothetical protein [Lentzea cavernae]GHH56577.1 hypothetical protein GCM10017774_74880 [Lentzea cavernae]